MHRDLRDSRWVVGMAEPDVFSLDFRADAAVLAILLALVPRDQVAASVACAQ